MCGLALAYTARPQKWGYCIDSSHGVSVYSPTFAVTYCTCPRRDDQAELTCMAGYILKWFTRLQMGHPFMYYLGPTYSNFIDRDQCITTTFPEI